MSRAKAKWSSRDAAFYLHNRPKRKTPIAYGTVATSRLLGMLAEDNPEATIRQVRNMIHYDNDAVAVCDEYIAHSEGDVVPMWRY